MKNRRISRFIVSMLAVLLIGGSYGAVGPARASASISARRRLEDLNLISTLAVTNPIRIMPLGDSITAGSASGTEADPGYYISYRKSLLDSLISSGYAVDYVGGEAGGYYESGFDSNHEGHPGWRDDQIADNIYNWLESSPADVILLHIGTNNLNTSALDVEDILDEIDAYESDHGTEIWVVLAKIINRNCKVNTPPCSEAATTTTFNGNVEGMAEARILDGDKIHVVDMENGAGIDYRLQPAGGDMWDNLHPASAGEGYGKMAVVWKAGLDSLLPFARPDSFTVDEDSNEILDVLGNDAGTSLVVTALDSDFPSDVLSIDGGTGIHYQPAADFNGSLFFTYTIDGVGNASVDKRTATVDVIINPVNDPPTANQDSKLVLEDQVLSFQADELLDNDSPGPPDESSQTLSVTEVSSTAATHGTVELSGGEITYTPDADYAGPTSFTYTVCEDLSPDTCDETNGVVNVTVENVNDAPSFTVGPDLVVNEDSGPQVIAGWATDISAGPGEASQALTFELNNDNPDLFSAQPEVNAQSGTLTYAPAENVYGAAQVSAMLSDDGGTVGGGQDNSDSQTFTISVAPVNDAPSVIVGEDQTVSEDSGPQAVASWVTDISAGPGESGQALTFVVSNYNPGLFSTQPTIDLQSGTLIFTPAANASGTAQVSIVLKDDGGTANGGQDSSSQHTFSISVTPVNDAPTFTGGGDQMVLNNSGAQVVAGWAQNISAGPGESGQALTFDVTNDNPGLFSAQPALDPQSGSLTYTPAGGALGQARVTVLLQDDGGVENGGSDTSQLYSFTITVRAFNTPPVLTRPVDRQFRTGERVLLQVEADDPDGDLLTYSAANLPPGLSLDPQTGLISGAPAPGSAGAYTVELSVSDGAATVTTSFTIHVVVSLYFPFMTG